MFSRALFSLRPHSKKSLHAVLIVAISLGAFWNGTSVVLAAAAIDPCVVPPGSPLPPVGCTYKTSHELHAELNAPGAGPVVFIDAEHGRFECPPGLTCVFEGGNLGGQVDFAHSSVHLRFSDDSGWSKTITVPTDFEVHTAQAQPTQAEFETEMVRLLGAIAEGDETFEVLEITAGTAYGYKGDGFTQFEQHSDTGVIVNSHFNLGFSIRIVGTPGGRFDGVDGSFDFNTTVQAIADNP
ncbi:MAG: hypothetical protein AAGC60_04075 [Acidobacteriota bacterium]